MKTETIKRGSIVSNIVPIKEHSNTNPVGTIGQVLRVKRKTNQFVVKFLGGFSSVIVSNVNVKLSSQTNQKIPKVGDIFVSIWGYGQTNNSWFKVKSVKNKTVSVVTIGETRTYTNGGMSGQSLANPSEERGDVVDRRIVYDLHGNPSIKVASYARAWLVEDINKPMFFSEWN